jgi:hypothetical protein
VTNTSFVIFFDGTNFVAFLLVLLLVVFLSLVEQAESENIVAITKINDNNVVKNLFINMLLKFVLPK